MGGGVGESGWGREEEEGGGTANKEERMGECIQHEGKERVWTVTV